MPEIPGGSFLPGDPRTQEPWHVNQQTILRAGVLAAIAIALFVLLAIRLWALQIISGNEYLRIAQSNQTRTVRLQAPRGAIVDRRGEVLVENRRTNAVLIWHSELPEKGERPTRYAVLRHLSDVLGIPMRTLTSELKTRRRDPLTPVVAKEDVEPWQRDYILERADQFPGVEISPRYVRSYRHGWLASQVLGYVRLANDEQIENDESGLIEPGDVVGQTGVEAAFDDYLRGTPGLASQRVDSQGRPRSELLPNPEPQPGDKVRLTIDADLQWATEKALANGIQIARNTLCDSCWNANGGAIVALDARDGAVRAMATSPTYPPSVFSGRVTQSRLARFGLTPSTAEEMNYPAINRATAGLYPPGSTFKPVTALAALKAGFLDPYQNLHCTGEMTVNDSLFRNWDPNADSWINLPTALAVSCDTYFYKLGRLIYGLPASYREPIQDTAKEFTLGSSTGIEIGDLAGVVPTKAWQRKHFKTPAEQIWKTGDSLNLSIGQKDLQVTPLQMARVYAAIATGKIVFPHLLGAIEHDDKIVDSGVPKAPHSINSGGAVFNGYLNVIREGLDMATHDEVGTSQPVFGNFSIPIAGKTGTAEKWSERDERFFDQSWWCGYGPTDKPELVVCAVIENGGHGGTAAAPAARQVFESYFGVESSDYVAPTHTD